MWLRSLQWPVLRNIDDTLYKAVADINYRGESSILPYVLYITMLSVGDDDDEHTCFCLDNQ